ncbi:hypothetical protein C8R43DRAFT_402172 [Mycena crocata]|nr:hypothetical protein C8R43DRAFT_402172 [Mycena crocata]
MHLTSITCNVYGPTIDFRMIPLGDINLWNEIQLDDESGLASRRNETRYARRVYSSKVGHRQADMTVALYEGKEAEKQWRQDILRYSHLRHPNIVQLYGAASSNGLHATIFHDELAPFSQFLDRYRSSHFFAVYTLASGHIDF